MNKFRFSFSSVLIAIAMLAFASAAQAQATRTWVSGVGDDANPCSRTAPCKTWAGAISKTFIHGEINAIDSGGFGALTITKSITVDGAGVHASTLAGAGNGMIINIAVNANDPFREVTLRNLSINGTGASGAIGTRTGLNGVHITANGAATVNIQDTIIENFSQNCINVAVATNLTVSNSQIQGCTGAGIAVDAAAISRVTVRDSSITTSGTGVLAKRNSRVAIYGSSISANATGVAVEGNGATAIAVFENCQVSNNTGIGVRAGGGTATTTSVARLSNNIVNNNAGSAVSIGANGSIETFGNNKIVGNNPDGCVGCTSISANLN